jgi:hypothetical protein
MRTTVETITPRTRRGVELLLTVFAVGLTLLAWISVDLGVREAVPAQLLTIGGGLLALALAFHLVVRWRATYADPLMLPIATLLNGFGLVMIHRLDLAAGQTGIDSDAGRQLIWTALSVVVAALVLIFLRDHRLLRRYTFTAMAVGLVLLLLPLLPGIGTTIYGSRIWIRIGPLSFQPGEIAKIALIIFFAGYLVSVRDVLSLAGRKVLGFTFPRGRDLGPILIAWLVSLAVLIFEKDLGSSLLFFGVFRVRPATSRRSIAPSTQAPRHEPAPPAQNAPVAPPPQRPTTSPVARPWLVIDGERYPLIGAHTVIGRDELADVVLDDPGVSRRHCEIRVTNDGPHLVTSIRDLGSTNGTFVNGQRITSTRLDEGDEITIGRTHAVFRPGKR